MRMPFGKYKGDEMDDLPTHYLRWLAENVSDSAVVKEAEDLLAMREGEGRPADRRDK